MIKRILFTTLFFLSTFVVGAAFEQSPIESKIFIHSYVQKVAGGSLFKRIIGLLTLLTLETSLNPLKRKLGSSQTR